MLCLQVNWEGACMQLWLLVSLQSLVLLLLLLPLLLLFSVTKTELPLWLSSRGYFLHATFSLERLVCLCASSARNNRGRAPSTTRTRFIQTDKPSNEIGRTRCQNDNPVNQTKPILGQGLTRKACRSNSFITLQLQFHSSVATRNEGFFTNLSPTWSSSSFSPLSLLSPVVTGTMGKDEQSLTPHRFSPRFIQKYPSIPQLVPHELRTM